MGGINPLDIGKASDAGQILAVLSLRKDVRPRDELDQRRVGSGLAMASGINDQPCPPTDTGQAIRRTPRCATECCSVNVRIREFMNCSFAFLLMHHDCRCASINFRQGRSPGYESHPRIRVRRPFGPQT